MVIPHIVEWKEGRKNLIVQKLNRNIRFKCPVSDKLNIFLRQPNYKQSSNLHRLKLENQVLIIWVNCKRTSLFDCRFSWLHVGSCAQTFNEFFAQFYFEGQLFHPHIAVLTLASHGSIDCYFFKACWNWQMNVSQTHTTKYWNWQTHHNNWRQKCRSEQWLTHAYRNPVLLTPQPQRINKL